MKIEIDFTNKQITILEEAPLGELINVLSESIKDWKNWKIVSKVSYSYYPYYPATYDTYSWIDINKIHYPSDNTIITCSSTNELKGELAKD